MNFSNSFIRGYNKFISPDGLCNNTFSTPFEALDKSMVFLYMISRENLYPIREMQDRGSVVCPVYWKTDTFRDPPITIRKAESILSSTLNTSIRTYILNGEIYYATIGMLFDKDKNPLLLKCHDTSQNKDILCMDYSVVEHPEEQMNRFILRKVLPFIVQRKPLGALYRIVNCKNFVVKPTFQGELDNKLVREFLVEKILQEQRMKDAGSH